MASLAPNVLDRSVPGYLTEMAMVPSMADQSVDSIGKLNPNYIDKYLRCQICKIGKSLERCEVYSVSFLGTDYRPCLRWGCANCVTEYKGSENGQPEISRLPIYHCKNCKVKFDPNRYR